MRRLLFSALFVVACVGAMGLVFCLTTGGPSECMAVQRELPMMDLPPARGPLVVGSLNLAHGRAEAAHQLLVGADDLSANLRAAGALFVSRTPHAILLQEVDGPSWWSGGLEQAVPFGRTARLPWIARGRHVEGWGLQYGTAVLTAIKPSSAVSYAFGLSPPTPVKGFVRATIRYQGVEVDLVSVQLDFAREGARMSEVELLIERLEGRGRPLVLGGDLSCEPGSEPYERLTAGLGLHTADPVGAAVTVPSSGRRVDWILASKHFRFRDYVVLPEAVSDHRALVASLVWAGRPSARPASRAKSTPTGR